MSMVLREAGAQIDPDDTGEGRKLGMAAEHNSGQTGTVTLLERGPGRTLVVLRLFSVPDRGREPARIGRTRSCRARGHAWETPLSPVTRGLSRTTVPLAAARLLSGNYSVEVFARADGGRVSCGELH